MPASKHTPEEKANALRIYRELGLAEAARQTGYKKATISSWAKRKKVQTVAPENVRAAIEMAALTREQRRDELTDLAIEEAKAVLLDHRKTYKRVFVTKDGAPVETTVMPDPSDRAKLSTSFGILFDKIQLATGGATNRTETVTKDEAENELADIVNLRKTG